MSGRQHHPTTWDTFSDSLYEKAAAHGIHKATSVSFTMIDRDSPKGEPGPAAMLNLWLDGKRIVGRSIYSEEDIRSGIQHITGLLLRSGLCDESVLAASTCDDFIKEHTSLMVQRYKQHAFYDYQPHGSVDEYGGYPLNGDPHRHYWNDREIGISTRPDGTPAYSLTARNDTRALSPEHVVEHLRALTGLNWIYNPETMQTSFVGTPRDAQYSALQQLQQDAGLVLEAPLTTMSGQPRYILKSCNAEALALEAKLDLHDDAHAHFPQIDQQIAEHLSALTGLNWQYDATHREIAFTGRPRPEQLEALRHLNREAGLSLEDAEITESGKPRYILKSCDLEALQREARYDLADEEKMYAVKPTSQVAEAEQGGKLVTLPKTLSADTKVR